MDIDTTPAAGGAGTGAPARLSVAFLPVPPTGTDSGTVELRAVKVAPGMRTAIHVIKGLAAAEGVTAAGTRLFPLPTWPVDSSEPTTGAITAAVAGEGVPPSAPVDTLSHTHYYAARLHAPPPPSAAAKGGGPGGGAGAAIIAGLHNALCCGA